MGIAALEKRLERPAAALEILADLAAARNPFQAAALEALAKHYEHGERNIAQALAMTRAAQALEDSAALRSRRTRLERRLLPADAGGGTAAQLVTNLPIRRRKSMRIFPDGAASRPRTL